MNYKNITLKFTIILFSLFFLLTANNVLAAELKLELNNNQVSVGDTIAVDVVLNTEGESINVVEGNIIISKGLDLLDIKELSLANSNFSQWARTPSWSKSDGRISFVGGAPGGLNIRGAKVFRIFFTAKSAGQVTFLPGDLKIYANDGFATLVGVHASPFNIDIKDTKSLSIKNELQTVIQEDFKSPSNIKVELGQDPSIFDGQKFVNISASDLESGIAYFEVKEGDNEPVKTNSSYVLQNQDKLEPIIIFAFDKAGNVSQRSLNPYSPSQNYLVLNIIVWVIGLGACLLVLFRIFKKWRLKK